MAILTIMKGLPLSYDRDLQEDKAPFFDTVDTLSACLDVYIQMLPGSASCTPGRSRPPPAGLQRHRSGRLSGDDGDALPGGPPLRGRAMRTPSTRAGNCAGLPLAGRLLRVQRADQAGHLRMPRGEGYHQPPLLPGGHGGGRGAGHHRGGGKRLG